MSLVRGYKAFDQNFQCRGYQYRVGETARCPKAVMCQEGFHFCPRALDCLKYYTLEGSRFAEVEARDPTVFMDKAVTTELRVVREISCEEFAQLCTGVFISYDEYGSNQATYVAGRRHGPYQSWYPSGERHAEATYADGKLTGRYQSWDVRGRLQYSYIFDHLVN